MQELRALLLMLLQLYVLLLMARLVLDWIQVFARDWRPRGILLVIAEAVYTVTDPPLRLARRLLPPLRLGGVALDLGFIAVMLVIFGLQMLLAM